MGKLFGRYSWKELKDLFVAGCRRFPVVLLFLLIPTIDAIVLNHDHGNISPRTEFLMMFYPLTAALLSLALRLWSEEVSKNSLSIIVQVITHLLLLVGCLWLTSSWPIDTIQGTALVAIVIVLVLAVFMISFFRSKNDLTLWNFTFRLLQGIAIAFVVGIVLTAGLTLLIESFRQLFGWNIDWHIRSDVYIICGLLIAPVVFLQFIPNDEEKHNESASGLPKVLQGVVHYLFVPLLFAYILTLYAYACKIVFTWTLPCGWVSWLVSTMMMGMVGILILIYPSQFQTEKRFDHLLRRWLPIVALPLLLLMTIGIYRRVSDYGITVMRLYLITLNLWCYFVCFFLIWKKGRRLWWIPASFGIILFLTSVGPQSFANMTLHKLKGDLKTLLTKNKVNNLSLPVTNDDMNAWINQQDSTTQRQVRDKLYYLGATYDIARLSNLLDTASYKHVSFYTYIRQSEFSESLTGYNLLDVHVIDIPDGCTRMRNFNESCKVLSEKGDTIIVESKTKEGKSWKFTLTKRRMRDINHSKSTPLWFVESDDAYLYINSFYYYGPYPATMDISGILLEKQNKTYHEDKRMEKD